MNKKIKSIALLFALTATTATQPMNWDNVKYPAGVATGVALVALSYYIYKSYNAVQEISTTAHTVNCIVDKAKDVKNKGNEVVEKVKDAVQDTGDAIIDGIQTVKDKAKEVKNNAQAIIEEAKVNVKEKVQNLKDKFNNNPFVQKAKALIINQDTQQETKTDDQNNISRVFDAIGNLIADNKSASTNEIDKQLTALNPQTLMAVLQHNNKKLLSYAKGKAAYTTIEKFYKNAGLISKI